MFQPDSQETRLPLSRYKLSSSFLFCNSARIKPNLSTNYLLTQKQRSAKEILLSTSEYCLFSLAKARTLKLSQSSRSSKSSCCMTLQGSHLRWKKTKRTEKIEISQTNLNNALNIKKAASLQEHQFTSIKLITIRKVAVIKYRSLIERVNDNNYKGLTKATQSDEYRSIKFLPGSRLAIYYMINLGHSQYDFPLESRLSCSTLTGILCRIYDRTRENSKFNGKEFQSTKCPVVPYDVTNGKNKLEGAQPPKLYTRFFLTMSLPLNLERNISEFVKSPQYYRYSSLP